MIERRKKIIVLILFSSFLHSGISFAQSVSGAQMERMRDLLEKEEGLKWKLDKGPEKFFVRNIEIKGITLLKKELAEETVMPFQNKWLCENEIQGIISAIKILYQKNGFPDEPKDVSFKVEKHILKIMVEEAQFKKRIK